MMCIVYIVSLRHCDGHNLCLTMLHQPCTRRLAVLGHALAPQVCSGTYSTSWMPCVWQQRLPSKQQQHQARHDSKPRSTCAAARFVHGCSAAQQTQQSMKIFDRGIHTAPTWQHSSSFDLHTTFACFACSQLESGNNATLQASWPTPQSTTMSASTPRSKSSTD